MVRVLQSSRSLYWVPASFILLLALIYAFSARILLSGFYQVEETNALTNGVRLQNTLDNAVASLDTTALSWAHWDQALNFLEDPNNPSNQEFVKSELTTESLVPTQSHAAAYIDSRGRILYATGLDFKTLKTKPFPPELRAQLKPGSPLLKLPTPSSFVRGLVQIPEGILLVAVRPVTNSKGTGKIGGAFLLARFIDADLIQQMSAQVQLPISLHAISDHMPSDFRMANQKIQEQKDNTSFRLPLNSDVNVVFVRSPDIYGRPVLLSRMETPRNVYQQGLASLRTLVITMLVIGSISGLALFLTQRSLERARNEQREHDALYRSLTLNSSDVLFALDSKENMLWFGDTQRFFGVEEPSENNLEYMAATLTSR